MPYSTNFIAEMQVLKKLKQSVGEKLIILCFILTTSNNPIDETIFFCSRNPVFDRTCLL